MDFQEYGYFDSEIVGYDEEGFPILDRAQNSEIFALFWSKMISNGVLGAPADCLMVQANEGMSIKVNPGFIIINGRFGYNPKPAYLTLDNAPSQYRRITAVIARLNHIDRKIELIFRNGDAAVNPTPPELIQPKSGDYYELCLALIKVESNQTVIMQSNITDTRYDITYCGVVTNLIGTLDLSVFFTQLNAFYDEYVKKFNDNYADFILKMDSAYQSYYTQLNDLYNTYVDKYNTDYADFTQKMLTAYSEYLSDLSAFFTALQNKGYNDMAEITQRLAAFESDREAAFDAWFELVKGKMSGDVAASVVLELLECEERIAELENMLIRRKIHAHLATEDGYNLTTESGDILEAEWRYAVV